MKKPNLLFLYTDEQAYRTLACYGNDKIQMPNLNAFSQTATVFDQTYVSQPICTPSRSTLLTGQWPHNTGLTDNNVPLPPETKCFPELLDDPDYATGHFGKWHLGDELRPQHGFDEWLSIEDIYGGHYSEPYKGKHSSYCQFLLDHGYLPEDGNLFKRHESARLPEDVSKPAYLAREASRFINENKDKPFVLFVNFLEPHMPFFGPRDSQYDPDEVDLPPNLHDYPGDDNSLRLQRIREKTYENGHSGLPLKTDADWRRMIANYWGLCSLVDTHVGTILDTLNEAGLDDDTIVVYTSDHGDMMGSHGLIAKTVMYEESVRVPFLLRTPGQSDTKRINGPVSQVDIVPTLLDLMGKDVPDCVQGKSLKSAVNADGDVNLQQDVVIEWTSVREQLNDKGFQANPTFSENKMNASLEAPLRTVITADGWKLTYSPIGESELYNLNDDPYERTNLINDPAQKERLAALIDKIRSWQAETGDCAPVG